MEYLLNKETNRIELAFSLEQYKALTIEQSKELKSAFLFSGREKKWISRSTQNHWRAVDCAKKLGFTNGGSVGESLSYAEELERKKEKASGKIEKFETYAENAEKRAERLQSRFNECRQDWSWLTQPNINSSAGRSFTNSRQKVYDAYDKGFEEYRKSEYYREKAGRMESIASEAQLQSKSYIQNRIDECKKHIRQLQKSIQWCVDNGRGHTGLDEKIIYQAEKMAFMMNKLEEIGGVTYSKDNINTGDAVFVSGSWCKVIRANTTTVTVDSGCGFELKYKYAEVKKHLKKTNQESEPKNEK